MFQELKKKIIFRNSKNVTYLNIMFLLFFPFYTIKILKLYLFFLYLSLFSNYFKI